MSMNNTTTAAPKAVKTITGKQIHRASGSVTDCGLFLKRFIVVNIAAVSSESKCGKCYHAKFNASVLEGLS